MWNKSVEWISSSDVAFVSRVGGVFASLSPWEEVESVATVGFRGTGGFYPYWGKEVGINQRPAL